MLCNAVAAHRDLRVPLPRCPFPAGHQRDGSARGGVGYSCCKLSALALPSPGLRAACLLSPTSHPKPCWCQNSQPAGGDGREASQRVQGCGGKMFCVLFCYKGASEQVMIWHSLLLPSVSMLVKIWFCPFCPADPVCTGMQSSFKSSSSVLSYIHVI